MTAPLCFFTFLLAIYVRVYHASKKNIAPVFQQLRTITMFLSVSTPITNTLVIFYRNKKGKTWFLCKIFLCCKKTRHDAGQEGTGNVKINPRPLYQTTSTNTVPEIKSNPGVNDVTLQSENA